MDFGKVLSRAWQITWRWKILWVLGFLVSLGSGGGGGNPSYSAGRGERLGGFEVPPEVGGFIIAVACLLFVVAIILWVVSVIARGGLIAGVQQVEDEGATSFGQAWRVGVSRFWTLFGVGVLAAIPMIVAVLVGLVVALAVLVPLSIAAGDLEEWAVAAGVLLPALVCGIPFACLLVIAGIVLRQIRIYAERAAVLEGLGWTDAFARGWQVLKENLGPTVVLWLIFLVIGFVLAAVVMIGLLIVGAPFLGLLLAAAFVEAEAGAWLLAPMACGGLLAVLLGAVFGSIVETFKSATWTLAYREMIELAPEPAAEQ